jgi:hypothetical protein
MEKAYFVYRHTAAPNGPQHMYIENIGQTWPVPQIEGWTYTGNVVLPSPLPLPDKDHSV